MTYYSMDVIELCGKFQQLIFYKDGFGIIKVKQADGTLTTVKGKIAKGLLTPGSNLAFLGSWKQHPKYGLSFQVADSPEQAKEHLTGSAELRFLSTLPHISHARATLLLARGGAGIFTTLYKTPETLLSGLPGLNTAKITEIKEWLVKNKPALGMELLLHKLDFGDRTITKIKDMYAPSQVQALRDNPYMLLSVPGIGFTMLDKKVLDNKVLPVISPVRGAAILSHVLDRVGAMAGHTLISKEYLYREAAKFGVTDKLILDTSITNALKDQKVVELDGNFGTAELILAEKSIANGLFSLAGQEVSKLAKLTGTYDEDQANAIKCMYEQPVSFLTGGPGSGKTYCISALLDELNGGASELKGLTKDVTLCAPTGKAAKRMTETTGLHACTVHSLLLGKNVCSTVIVDECSMLSTELAAELITYLKSKKIKRLVMVGDPDQLPSIGAGRVFDDLLDSGIFPVTRLTKVRRQEMNSNIILNSAAIREGKDLIIDNNSDFKVSFVPIDKQDDLLIKAFTDRIPKLNKADGTPMDPLRDVQVIVPQHKGRLGCTKLNSLLQDVLNPKSDEKEEWPVSIGDFSFRYRVGDKIIVTKNSRDLGLVNGDIGFIREIASDTVTIGVEDEDGERDHTFSKLEPIPLRPAYAITVHKVQGSEAPMVIVVYNAETPKMFRERNMLYTAVTRAREMCYILGDEGVIREAIANNNPDRRQTGLISQLNSLGQLLPDDHACRQRLTLSPSI